jgi:hypothetical protein
MQVYYTTIMNSKIWLTIIWVNLVVFHMINSEIWLPTIMNSIISFLSLITKKISILRVRNKKRVCIKWRCGSKNYQTQIQYHNCIHRIFSSPTILFCLLWNILTRIIIKNPNSKYSNTNTNEIEKFIFFKSEKEKKITSQSTNIETQSQNYRKIYILNMKSENNNREIDVQIFKRLKYKIMLKSKIKTLTCCRSTWEGGGRVEVTLFAAQIVN